jgi:cytochrome P450
MTTNGSPTDWVSDYDIFDPDFVRDPYPLMSEIRESACPVAHTDRWGGSWMPTRYDDIVAAAQEYDIFTSRNIIVVPPPTGQIEGPYAGVAAPPITSDPPEHHWHRRTILPDVRAAGGRQVRGRHASAVQSPHRRLHRRRARRRRSGLRAADPGACDRHDARGSVGDGRRVHVVGSAGVLEIGLTDPKVRVESRMKILGFFRAQLDDRKANPREDDLITELLNTRVDGEPVSEDYVMGVCNLMLVAGIDTTWSAIGSSLWHLAQHPEHRRQLREQPEIWPTALEELLRAYSPVTMARIVDRDTEFQGCPMHEGDRVLMSFPAANRDPRQFENPDEVILDREHNRHVAFGSGIHRCAGSNLARLELRVALQTWMERIPEFELVDPAAVTWAGGQVRGPRRCLVRFPTEPFGATS